MRAFMEMRVDGLILAGTMPESTTIGEAATRLLAAVAGSRDFNLAGRRVTRVLLDRITDPGRNAVEYLVTPMLQVRSSTGLAPLLENEADNIRYP